MKVNISFTNPTYEVEPNDTSFESDNDKNVDSDNIDMQTQSTYLDFSILTFLVSS